MFVIIVKTIGIILLAILIIAIVFILCDIKYNIRIVKKESIGFKAYIECQYMLNIFKIKGIYYKKFIYNARVFFFKFTNKNIVKSKKNDTKKVITTKIIDDNDYIFFDRDEILSIQQDIKDLNKDIKKGKKHNDKPMNKKNNIFKKIIDIVKEKDIHTMKYLFLKAKELLKIIAPDIVKGDIAYGLFNPFNTGIILAFAGIFNTVHNNEINVKKEMNVKNIEFDIDFSGRISPILAIKIFIQVYLNKKTRVLLFG